AAELLRRRAETASLRTSRRSSWIIMILDSGAASYASILIWYSWAPSTTFLVGIARGARSNARRLCRCVPLRRRSARPDVPGAYERDRERRGRLARVPCPPLVPLEPHHVADAAHGHRRVVAPRAPRSRGCGRSRRPASLSCALRRGPRR